MEWTTKVSAKNIRSYSTTKWKQHKIDLYSDTVQIDISLLPLFSTVTLKFLASRAKTLVDHYSSYLFI